MADTSTTAKAELSKRCLAAADAAGAMIDWILDEENAPLVGSEQKLLLKQLRGDEARARKLAEASTRPMSIGVYGPSQAGKSYLVSVLAKPQDGRLIADLDGLDQGLDFITQINPEGDKEATGLVTRFTMQKDSCPPGFPVHLRLLSEADIIRILANTFFKDGDNSEAPPTAEDIDGILNQIRGRAGSPARGLSALDVWEIQAYFEANFRGSAYAQGLSAFWDEAAELAPQLAAADRVKLMGLLWGNYPQFGELYGLLIRALDELGHPKEIFAAIEALQPRNISIIDVKTLEGLDLPEGQDSVRVRSDKGREIALPRPVVTALTAELILPMRECSWPIFETSDLLDFPGVRERRAAKGPIETFFNQSETPLKDLFLRGKVAFLFDRYVAEQELTSMLLCVPPSNIEVAADLSLGVENWINKTQGATPDERAEVDTILFFVLTKFDMHLVDKAGAGEPHQRFQNRFEASLIAPFGNLRESWPLNWTPGQPFKHCYWLRNPNYPAEAIFDYDAEGKESLRAGKNERLEELKQGSLQSALVQTHMHDPAAAWDAALTPNDGGVRYLVENLTPISKPEIKVRQIEARRRALVVAMAARLKPFYSDDDIAERLEKRRRVATEVLHDLNDSFDNRKFGRLLEGLAIDPSTIRSRIERLPSTVQVVASSGPTARSSGERRRRLPPGVAATAERPEKTSADDGGVRSMTRERFQAETAFTTWLERMRQLAERADVETHLHLTSRSVLEVTSEMASAARRLKIVDEMEAELVTWNAGKNNPAAASLVSAERINALVNKLGVDRMSASERPAIEDPESGSKRRAFDGEPIRYSALGLPEWSERRDERFLEDWTFALFRMFEDNATSDESGQRNVKQNSRLGLILETLSD